MPKKNNIAVPGTVYLLQEGEKTSLFDRLCLSLDLKTTAGREALTFALENVILLDRKQQDYGSRNISGFGLFGVVVRMNDKFERIKNLVGKRRRAAQNESLRDTFRDVSNYATIALMLDAKRWPNE